jgi:hypothetical protein
MRHLERILRDVEHDKQGRPHGGIDLSVRDATRTKPATFTSTANVQRPDVLGRLIHECELAA